MDTFTHNPATCSVQHQPVMWVTLLFSARSELMPPVPWHRLPACGVVMRPTHRLEAYVTSILAAGALEHRQVVAVNNLFIRRATEDLAEFCCAFAGNARGFQRVKIRQTAGKFLAFGIDE